MLPPSVVRKLVITNVTDLKKNTQLNWELSSIGIQYKQAMTAAVFPLKDALYCDLLQNLTGAQLG